MTSAVLRVLRAAALVGLVIHSAAACDTRAALAFEPATLPDATVGEAYDVEIVVTQNVTPVGGIAALDNPPPGLALDYSGRGSGSARLAGTPTTAGTFTFTIEAWCFGTNVSGQVGRRMYTLVIR